VTAAAAAWAGVLTTLLLALLGVTWRAGSRLSELTTTVKAFETRLSAVERHVEKHDDWHFNRLTNGKDTR